VGSRHGGALAREWRAAAARIDLGVPQADALGRLVARCPVPAVSTLVAALRRAERHGAPLSDTLAAQAAEARAAHARRLHEQAAKAAPKIQLVVALMLVPSAMLLVAAALVASLGSSG
jgi:tight adherence protein C